MNGRRAVTTSGFQEVKCICTIPPQQRTTISKAKQHEISSVDSELLARAAGAVFTPSVNVNRHIRIKLYVVLLT